MEAYLTSIRPGINMRVAISELSRRDQVNLLLALMGITGYADALYATSSDEISRHLERSWSQCAAYISAEPRTVNPLSLADQIERKGLDYLDCVADPFAVKETITQALRRMK